MMNRNENKKLSYVRISGKYVFDKMPISVRREAYLFIRHSEKLHCRVLVSTIKCLKGELGQSLATKCRLLFAEKHNSFLSASGEAVLQGSRFDDYLLKGKRESSH
jgi:hypothetical protein